MTYDEYQAWYGEGQRGEWVDGEVIQFAPSTARGALANVFFLSILYVPVVERRGGDVFTSTFVMRSTERSARTPDVMVVLKESRNRVEEYQLRGPADLVVEIVSDDSVARDRQDKVREYAEIGVPEYWLVDPRRGHNTIDVLTLLPDGSYAPVQSDVEGRIHSLVLPGVWADACWLAGDELPSALDVHLAMAAADTSVGQRTLDGS